jgi:hypothetical protein
MFRHKLSRHRSEVLLQLYSFLVYSTLRDQPHLPATYRSSETAASTNCELKSGCGDFGKKKKKKKTLTLPELEPHKPQTAVQ